MKTPTKVVLIIATISLVGGIVLSVSAYVLAGFDLGRLSSASEYTKSSYMADKGNYQEITVTGISEDISVVRTSAESVEIEYYENDQQTYSIDEKDSSLEITETYEWNFLPFNFNWGGKDTTLVIKVPASFEGSLLLTTVSGNITVHDLGKLESLQIENQSGDISVTGTALAGYIKVTSTSGNLDLSDISSGQAWLFGVSGNINAQRITADSATIESTSGNIEVLGLSASEIGLKTVSGDIEAQVNGSSDDYRIDATTVSGNINVPLGASGSSKYITLASVSGNLKLTFS
jgi:DUF4097 and DUF4098 domain-containing protein YvlB